MKPVRTPYLYEKGELYRSVTSGYTLLGFLVLPYIPGTTVEIPPLSILLALGDHKQDAPVRATINFYNFISLSHNRIVWLRDIDLNCLDRVSPKQEYMEPGLMIRADVPKPNTANRLGLFFDGYYAQPGLFFDDRLKGPRFWKHGDFVLLLERYHQSTIWWKALHLRSQTVIFLQDVNLQYFWKAGPDECAFD